MGSESNKKNKKLRALLVENLAGKHDVSINWVNKCLAKHPEALGTDSYKAIMKDYSKKEISIQKILDK